MPEKNMREENRESKAAREAGLVIYRNLLEAAEAAASSAPPAQELLVVGLDERREPTYFAV